MYALMLSSYGYVYDQYDPAMPEQPTLHYPGLPMPAVDETSLAGSGRQLSLSGAPSPSSGEGLRSSCGRFASPAARRRRWAGFAPLAPRGGRRTGPREGPLLVEFLERSDPHTVGHASPRDGGGFDRLEQFLPGSAVVDGSAHMGGHAILEAS